MYLKENVIKILKIKNVIFTVFGVFNSAVSASIIISLITYYRDDLDTALHAKAIPDSVTWLIIGIILLIIAGISKYLIGDALFYSSYFEGDLDGNIKYSDLAKVTGKSPLTVKIQLVFFKMIYMKNYKLNAQNYNGQVVLYSKKCTCECRHCGAHIEKKVYFTGICPYCGSSDIFAKVLTNNKFYSITNTVSDGIKKPEYYSAKNIKAKKAVFLSLLCLGLSVITIIIFFCLSNLAHYNDQEYLKKVLLSPDNHLYSYKLIKADILDSIVWGVILFLALAPLTYNRYKKTKYILAAETYAEYFSKCKVPFIKANDLPAAGRSSSEKRKIKSVRRALRRGYLLNCTLEMHNSELKIALAKKIVKDECPSCGASIVGAVDENYKCQYCGNLIMGVISKK